MEFFCLLCLEGVRRASREPFHLRHTWGSSCTAFSVPAAEDGRLVVTDENVMRGIFSSFSVSV